MRSTVKTLALAVLLSAACPPAYGVRQIYTYSASANLTTLQSAIAGNFVGSVNRIDTPGQQAIYIDSYDGQTSAEQTTVSGIATGAPYNLTLVATDASVNALPWTPLDLPGLVTWVDAGHQLHQWQENQTQIAATHPQNNTDPVGQLDDSSPGVRIIQAGSNASRPLTQSDVAPETHLQFGGANHLTVADSKSSTIYDFINTTGIFSVLYQVRFDADGAATYFLDDSGGSTGNNGINIIRNVTNHLIVLVSKAAAGQAVWNAVTTQTMVVADSWQTLAIWSSDGVHLNIKWGAHATETFNSLFAPGGGNAQSDLEIGSLSGGTLPTHFSLRAMVIMNQGVSSSDLTHFTNYVVRRTQSSLVRLAAKGLYNFGMHFFDFTNTAVLWQDTARTMPVTMVGQNISYVDNGADLFSGFIGRHLSLIAGAAPTYQGPTSGALYGGTASMQISQIHPIAEGSMTFVSVVNQTTANPGSDIVSDGSASSFYVRVLGSGAAQPNTFIANLNGASLSNVPLYLGSNYNVVTIRHSGTSWTAQSSFAAPTNSVLPVADLSFDNVGINSMGGPGMIGNYLLHALWNAQLTDAQMTNIKVFCMQKWPGVSYGP